MLVRFIFEKKILSEGKTLFIWSQCSLPLVKKKNPKKKFFSTYCVIVVDIQFICYFRLKFIISYLFNDFGQNSVIKYI